jgi:hypothetical protein
MSRSRADADHRLVDLLVGVVLAVHKRAPEHLGVQTDGLVEVRYRDAYMVDGKDPGQAG